MHYSGLILQSYRYVHTQWGHLASWKSTEHKTKQGTDLCLFLKITRNTRDYDPLHLAYIRIIRKIHLFAPLNIPFEKPQDQKNSVFHLRSQSSKQHTVELKYVCTVSLPFTFSVQEKRIFFITRKQQFQNTSPVISPCPKILYLYCGRKYIYKEIVVLWKVLAYVSTHKECHVCNPTSIQTSASCRGIFFVCQNSGKRILKNYLLIILFMMMIPERILFLFLKHLHAHCMFSVSFRF